MKWRPTPEDELITARKLVGDGWVPCRFEELRKGDVFRAVDPDGQFIRPTTLEPDEDAVSLAIGDAIKCDSLGADGQTYGYGVPVEVYPTFADLNRKGLS